MENICTKIYNIQGDDFMIQINIISDNYTSEENQSYIGYGIIGVESNKEIYRAEDITDELESIESLISIMNQEELDVIGLYDIIEDFIS